MCRKRQNSTKSFYNFLKCTSLSRIILTLLVAHGDLIHAQTILLLPLLPVDAGHEGGSEDEADDAEQGQHHATPDVGQQQGLNITIQPTLKYFQTFKYFSNTSFFLKLFEYFTTYDSLNSQR